jgi:prepilin-type N-terminal cleavage/methylation domain-containing protein/prepilin-type processing-associated H-X9-DG protein
LFETGIMDKDTFVPLWKARGIVMHKGRGFTLVELLVVIAIIALLMSILMPALGRVKRQAKAVMCMANLKQWCIIFTAYTSDNDGYFPPELGDQDQGWVAQLRPYYTGSGRPGGVDGESRGERGIRLCPAANSKFRSNGYMGSHAAWGIYKGDTTDEGAWWAYKGDSGSYGLNGWVCNEDPEVDDWWEMVGALWRTADVKGAANVPLFMDCQWVDGWPEDRDEPPPYEGALAAGGDYYFNEAMKQFCVNRHNGQVNGLFLDCSVRTVGLKELWTLNWHRWFDVKGDWTLAGGADKAKWANHGTGWLKNFEEY